MSAALRRGLTWLLAVVLALVLGLFFAGQAGMLTGTPPVDLGVNGGRLKPPSMTSNSVSSQAALYAGHPQQAGAQIAPLPLQGPPAETIGRLAVVVRGMPGAVVVAQRDDYLYVQFTTRWLHFVDDAEFWADPASGAVQVRSASRLGRKDRGVNRARIGQIRAALAAAP